MKLETITSQIEAKAFELLNAYPEGVRWIDLNSMIIKSNREFHPKTVNGTVWKLPQKYPDLIYKPSKGIFRLLKFKTD